MNLIDRVFCLVLGHVWEPSPRFETLAKCPHCGTFGKRHLVGLEYPGGIKAVWSPPPKRCW